MSTHCYIGKVTDDGKVRYVFCRFDGYLEHTGKVLLESYDKNNIDSLLDLGDLSFLGSNLAPTNSESDMTTVYHTVGITAKPIVTLDIWRHHTTIGKPRKMMI